MWNSWKDVRDMLKAGGARVDSARPNALTDAQSFTWTSVRPSPEMLLRASYRNRVSRRVDDGAYPSPKQCPDRSSSCDRETAEHALTTISDPDSHCRGADRCPDQG